MYVTTHNVLCIFEQWFDVKGHEGCYEFLEGGLKIIIDREFQDPGTTIHMKKNSNLEVEDEHNKKWRSFDLRILKY